MPDHLFLHDKNDIIRKSGVHINNRHEFNPNRARPGQSYPFFFDPQGERRGGMYNQQHGGYNQQYQGYGQEQYGGGYGGGYGDGYDPYYQNYGDDSSSDSSFDGQNFNHNGQNFKVVSSQVFRGNHQS